MRGRIISATATHVRLELEAQMKTVTVDRWGGCRGPEKCCGREACRGVVLGSACAGAVLFLLAAGLLPGRIPCHTTPQPAQPLLPPLHRPRPRRSHLAVEDGGRTEAAPRPGYYPSANTPMAAGGRTPMHPGASWVGGVQVSWPAGQLHAYTPAGWRAGC